MNKLILVLSIFTINKLNAQSYFFPKLNINVFWSVNEDTTKFSIFSNRTDLSTKWLGVGINNLGKLVF